MQINSIPDRFCVDKKGPYKIINSLIIFGGTDVSVRIRLQRVGTKKRAFYRVVVIDGRKQRDGGFLEQVGLYQPIAKENQFSINADKVSEWIKKGAQVSDTVVSLLQKQGIWNSVRTAK